MNEGKWQFAMRELRRFFTSGRYWLTILVVVLVFTVTGPFGTGERMPLLQRLSFWTLLHVMAFSTALVCALAVDVALVRALPWKLARMMLGSALAALPIGVGITLLQAGFAGEPISGAEMIHQAGLSVPLCLLLCLLTYLTTGASTDTVKKPGTFPDKGPSSDVAPRFKTPDVLPAAVESTASPPLLQRLRPETRGLLLRLSVQDHYTEVVTSRGRELVLLRFSDALAETGDRPGRRIHRSHWIADDHVDAIVRDRGKLFIRTRDGILLPVSRPYEAEVKARFGALQPS